MPPGHGDGTRPVDHKRRSRDPGERNSNTRSEPPPEKKAANSRSSLQAANLLRFRVATDLTAHSGSEPMICLRRDSTPIPMGLQIQRSAYVVSVTVSASIQPTPPEANVTKLKIRLAGFPMLWVAVNHESTLKFTCIAGKWESAHLAGKSTCRKLRTEDQTAQDASNLQEGRLSESRAYKCRTDATGREEIGAIAVAKSPRFN